MQRHKERKYDAEQIGRLIRLLNSDEPIPEEVRAEIDDLLLNEQYTDEVADALEEVWDDSANEAASSEYIRAQKQITLEGIARKCEDFPAKPERTAQTEKRIPLHKKTFFRVAAVLLPLVVLGVSLGLWVTGRTGGSEGENTTIGTLAAIVIEATDGERLVELPDGSEVKLKKGGSLEYTDGFMKNRVVALKGDAFFKVTKSAGQSFEVKYNDITVRVLGTEFHLSERGTLTEVTLFSGSVAVESAGGQVVLEPRQQFVADSENQEYAVVELTEEDITRLYYGRLEFHQTPLRTALEQTAEFFGVEIDMSLLSYNEPVRLSFDEQDQLEDVLYMLQAVTGNAFSYRIEGTQVIIQNR